MSVRTDIDLAKYLVKTTPAEASQDVQAMILRTGALHVDGHFGLKSGLHSREFVQFAALAKRPLNVERIAQFLAGGVLQALGGSEHVDCVVVPNSAASVLGYELALALQSKLAFVSLDARGYPDRFTPNFEVPPGQNVLLAADVVTTGTTLVCMDKLCEQAGVAVAAVAAFAVRGYTGIADLSLACPPDKRFALAEFRLSHYEAPDGCPDCKAKVDRTSFWDLSP